ncbi:MAG: hypothetical protein A4E23_01086 [Methanomethylovorans sp. PtaU1.Bin073]|nr:MAG: hypothetical protein A4E23_01086 [Methanomethylovorans sp. PtaU1.Bin073]
MAANTIILLRTRSVLSIKTITVVINPGPANMGRAMGKTQTSSRPKDS